MTETTKVRIDKYLWSIRLFKTRALASEACEKGRVKLSGIAVKASKPVNLNDEYEVKTDSRKWIIKVTGIINKRVAYAEAIKNYIDQTPEEERDVTKFVPSSFHTGKRMSKIGRPTKRNQRSLDDFLND